jgi:hypothetical protein
MAHEAWEVLEVSPETVDLGYRAGYRNGALHPDTMARIDYSTSGFPAAGALVS